MSIKDVLGAVWHIGWPSWFVTADPRGRKAAGNSLPIDKGAKNDCPEEPRGASAGRTTPRPVVGLDLVALIDVHVCARVRTSV